MLDPRAKSSTGQDPEVQFQPQRGREARNSADPAVGKPVNDDNGNLLHVGQKLEVRRLIVFFIRVQILLDIICVSTHDVDVDSGGEL